MRHGRSAVGGLRGPGAAHAQGGFRGRQPPERSRPGIAWHGPALRGTGHRASLPSGASRLPTD